MDVDRVLQSLQERDKWRGRLQLLQASLRDLRGRERRAELRLRRIKRELAQLSRLSDAILDQARHQYTGGASRAHSSGPELPAR
jgi:hypothetical protein